MRKLRFAALALALGLAAFAQPRTGSADSLLALAETGGLTLRDRIMVDDDVVRLGDLFQESLSDGDVAIAQAPKPGQTLALEGRFLQQIARAYRLDWTPVSRQQKVMVGRMSQKVTAEMVRVALAEAVQARIGSANELDVALDGGDLEFDLPTDVENSVAVSGINFNAASSRFAAILVVPADGPPLVERTVYGTVYEMAQVPVPSRLISAGEVVSAADLQWQPVQIARLANNSLTDAQQVVGHMAKRPLKAGQVLRSSDLALAPAVKKNDLVRVVVQTGQMTLSVQGKVLQDAAIGQTVRVLNVTSNRQLSGTVLDGGTVAVGFAVPAIN
jgi:flagella basal body P-ring formation protein FlgA